MQPTSLKNLNNTAPLIPFLEKFTAATGFATTLLDHNSQEILFKTGWRDCCLNFHRKSPESAEGCKKSNAIMASHVHQLGEVYLSQCEKNLMIGCTPVIIKGQRIADLIMGQVLFAPQDSEIFRAQAQKYGYPEQKYLESLVDLPVIDQKTFGLTLQFLANIAALLLQQNPPQTDFLSDSLSQFAEQFTTLGQIVELAEVAIFIGDIDGRILQANQSAVRLAGYPQNELIGQHISCLFPPDHLNRQPLPCGLLKKDKITLLERQIKMKDGTIIDVETNCQSLSNGHFRTFIRDISERKSAQKTLLAKQRDLQTSQILLKETNIALKVMLRESELDKKDFEEKVSTNLLGMVNPYLDKLKKTVLNDTQKNYLKIIEASLNNVVSPFVRTSVAVSLKLSPTEIRIANLLKQGMTSKQIAERLILSPQTIDKHRGNIRKKIGITNQKVNLRSLLESQKFQEAGAQDSMN